MPTLECYPRAKHLYIYAYVREGPTLELPWSDAPVYMRRPPTLELPWTLRATLYLPWSGLPLTRLPCTYPGAGKPAPPRLPGRLTRRTWPFSPLPPRAPRPPGLPKTPRPPPTLELALDPGRAPRGGCERAGDLGCLAWARGPIRIFRKNNLYGKAAKSTHGTSALGAPTLELPWSPRARANPDGERGRRTPKAGEGRDAYPGARDRPTLHLPAEGRSRDRNQPKPNAPENPYAPPRGRMCWGNRGEVRLTLSRS